MKVILSRKGFDSACGCMPSPIMPDGTLLSLPIPSDNDITYSDISWCGKTYLDIIYEINPWNQISSHSSCHLDPDLREEIYPRIKGWKPAFGQKGASLTELNDNGVSVGDLFLFFGWFKETEEFNGKLRFKPQARDLHIIYGYMQIGNIIKSRYDVPDWLTYHPHFNYMEDWEKGLNAIFLPTDKLSFDNRMPGSGTFTYEKRYVLTKDGYSRSRWEFPESMKGTAISHNPRGWKDNYFQSAARGQEFIMEGTDAVMEWVMGLFKKQ